MCYFVSKRTTNVKGAFFNRRPEGNRGNYQGRKSILRRRNHRTTPSQRTHILQASSWKPQQGSTTSTDNYKQKDVLTKSNKRWKQGAQQWNSTRKMQPLMPSRGPLIVVLQRGWQSRKKRLKTSWRTSCMSRTCFAQR